MPQTGFWGTEQGVDGLGCFTPAARAAAVQARLSVMSLIATLLRAALPVGSARRDALLGVARRAGVVAPAPESSYQRWIKSFEGHTDDAHGDPVGDPAQIDSGIVAGVRFRITIRSGTTNPAAVTRTLVSLVNQTFSHWEAHLPDPTAVGSASCKRVLADALQAEARFTTKPLAALTAFASSSASTASAGQALVRRRTYDMEINLGDALAPSALAKLAAAAQRHPYASLISAEFDMIDPFSGRRTAPASIGPWEPDLAQQFDLDSGCVVRQVGPPALGTSTAENHRASPSSIAPRIAPRIAPHVAPHVDAVLVHRLVGPRARASSLLAPASVAGVGTASTTSLPVGAIAAASSRRNGGTRVRHPITAGTTAAVIVRDPLPDAVAAQHHLAMLMKTAGSQVEVLHTGSWATGSDVGPIPEADVIVVIDGGLSPQENGWLGDLVGVLQQPHVFAVSPLVLVSSGVVLDGGVVRAHDGLAARSGRCDLAPFELERCRQVSSLSGRALAIDRNDFVRLAVAFTNAGPSNAIAQAAGIASRCCLVWAHQRWVLDRGIDARSTDSPMLAWSSGRLRSWFDPHVSPHRPEPGRAGEGVW